MECKNMLCNIRLISISLLDPCFHSFTLPVHNAISIIVNMVCFLLKIYFSYQCILYSFLADNGNNKDETAGTKEVCCQQYLTGHVCRGITRL